MANRCILFLSRFYGCQHIVDNIYISIIQYMLLMLHVLLQIFVHVHHGRQLKQSYDAVKSRQYREKNEDSLWR